MPRPERVLDPQDGPVARLAADLRALRDRAGRPGYRELARRAHFSATTLSDAASGKRLPTLAVTLAFVDTCGGDRAEWEKRWRAAAAAVTDETVNTDSDAIPPYRGLAAYQPEDAPWFFGRTASVADLRARLAAGRFLAVFGPSGSGKSSLLRAGLLAGVRRDQPGHPSILMTPGAGPIGELSRQLSPSADVAPEDIDAQLRGGGGSLHRIVLGMSSGDPDAELLIVVDQFEEVFTLCADLDEREAFIVALVAAARTPGSRARVVLGVRADFYDRCAAYPELVAALTDRQVLIGPMHAAELRQAIVGPAERAGLMVDGALVSTVVAEVAHRPGALPLISHALLEAWRRRRGSAITLAGYQAAGGIRDAIAQTAERLYEELSERQRALALNVLARLVEVGVGGETNRRPMRRAEVGPDDSEVAAVVEQLAAARLVVVRTDTVELAHEALIQGWPRLADFLDGARDALRMNRQLTHAAEAWEAFGGDPSALLRGGRLAGAVQLADAGAIRLTDTERRFLDSSRAAQEHETANRRRRTRLSWVAMTAAVVVVGLLAGVSLLQAHRAADERDVARSRQLAADARSQLSRDPELALLLAEEAYRIRPTGEASAALRQATLDSHVRAVLSEGTGPVQGVAFGPHGQLAATASDGTVRVWDRVAGGSRPGAPTVLRGHTENAWCPAFAPNGSLLATAGLDGTVRLWPLRDGGKPVILTGHEGRVWCTAFSQDSRRVASVGEDGTVRIWWADQHAPPTVLRGHTARTVGVAFSPDGKWLASGSEDNTVRLWPLTGDTTPRVLRGQDSSVEAVAFSPDSRRLATAGTDGTARIWELSGESSPTVLRGQDGTVEFVAFSADGRRLVTTGNDSTVRIWSTTSAVHPLVIRGHRGTVWAAAFSPDGSRLATASDDGTVRLWDPATVQEDRTFQHRLGPLWVVEPSADGRLIAGVGDGPVQLWPTSGGEPSPLEAATGVPSAGTIDIAVSRDSRQLATGGSDGAVRLWEIPAVRPPLVLKSEVAQPVWSVAFSPDGQHVVGGGGDGVVRLWEIATGQQRVTWRGHSGTVRGVAVHPTGRQVASAGWDGNIRLWTVDGSAPPVVLQGHQGPVWTVAFSPDGRYLASGGSDGTVRVWPLAGGEPAVLRGHQGEAWSLAYAPDGRQIVSSGSDGTVQFWSLADGLWQHVVIEALQASVETLTYLPNGTGIVSAHDDGTARIWRCPVCGPIDDVLALSRERTTRELSADERRTFVSRPT